jgi:hypothetical protein
LGLSNKKHDKKNTFWRKNHAWLYTLLTKIVNVFVNNPGTGRDILNIPAGLDSAGQSKKKKNRHIFVLTYG